MKAKQENSGHKFVRRNSNSPWETSVNLQISQQRINSQNSKIMSNRIMFNRNTTASIYHKQSFTHTRAIDEQCMVATATKKKTENEYDCRTVAHRAPELNNRQLGLKKDEPQIKLTYINLDSVSTFESLPTARKKFSQNVNPSLSTQKIQQLQLLKKELSKLSQQNRVLQLTHNQTMAHIKQLTEENGRINKINIALVSQLNNTKKALDDSQDQLKTNRQAYENVIRSLQQIQKAKKKEQQNAKYQSLLTKKLDDELRQIKQQNEQIKTVIETNNKQIQKLKQANKNLEKKLKAKQKQIQSSECPTNRSLRSVTIQQSNVGVRGNRNHNSNAVLTNTTKSNASQQTIPKTSPNTSLVSNTSSKKASINRVQSELSLLKNQIKQKPMPVKCNRFVQTQHSNLQKALKQNEQLCNSVRNKDKIIKNQQKDIKAMSNKLDMLGQLESKLVEHQKLIEVLNNKIITFQTSKIAFKYKYY